LETHTIFGESGVIRRAAEPFLAQRMKERRIYHRLEWINALTTRRRWRVRSRPCSMKKVLFPKRPWAQRIVNQLVGLPSLKHDDAVDTCAIAGLMLNQTSRPYVSQRGPAHRPTSWMSR
jgi:hypothetical protein